MKTTCKTEFRLYSEDYDFCARSKSLDKLISQVRVIARSAEESQECSFMFRIMAVKTTKYLCGGRYEYNDRRYELATLTYDGNGELDIDYKLNFE